MKFTSLTWKPLTISLELGLRAWGCGCSHSDTGRDQKGPPPPTTKMQRKPRSLTVHQGIRAALTT